MKNILNNTPAYYYTPEKYSLVLPTDHGMVVLSHTSVHPPNYQPPYFPNDSDLLLPQDQCQSKQRHYQGENGKMIVIAKVSSPAVLCRFAD